MDRHRLDLDLHRLDLRFAGSRLVEPQAVARIAQSIERCGQIVPCIVVAVPGGASTGADPRVLIDGYRRVAALRRLGRDTARVEQWTCDLTEALLGVLARTQDRRFASIEEALLLRELVQGQGLSQHDLARCSGRDVSWVSRRLALLSALPDAALAAVRAGKLSSWAANRIVVPLARANSTLIACWRCWPWRRCPPASCNAGSNTTSGPRDPCASAWSTIPVCFSTPGGRPMNDAPANDCALARKANALPICAVSRRCSYA